MVEYDRRSDMLRLQRIIPLLLVGLFLSVGSISHAADGCSDCHGDEAKMRSLGFPKFTVTDREVLSQSRMDAACSDCHLGNPGAGEKDAGHKGLLTLRVIKQKTWEAITRDRMDAADRTDWPDLVPRGEKRFSQLLPKRVENGKVREHPAYKTIILHDKNPETLAFNPLVAEKTCGRCHADIVKTFLKSPMGGAKGAHTQSQYSLWTGPTGPQSCGLWLGIPAMPGQDRFADDNIRQFNSHSTMPIKEETAYNMQKNCNTCHVGCLDCHLNPGKKDGSPGNGQHTFVKKPSPLSCYGGGRSFSCHAGPLERRRGDGYIRDEFAQASTDGMAKLRDYPDVHLRNGIFCVDCHGPNRDTGHHADLRRDVQCGKCHAEAVKLYSNGPHKNVDCASCHTQLIGGYAFNFWSAVNDNPATRIQNYLTDAVTPLLIKNPLGIWIPVHVVPHTSGNVKAGEVRRSKRLLFRNRPDSAVDRRYVSNDSYAVTGLARNVDKLDNDVMLWLNLDRVAHATGRARGCASCHDSQAQRTVVRFEGGSYKDVEDGAYTIIADKRGLRISDFKGPDGGPPAEGLIPFKDYWELKGDFSMPRIKNKKLYRKLEGAYKAGSFNHGQ